MPLTDAQCKNAQAPEGRSRARLTDGLGMYLEVAPTGAKLWRLKYRFAGKEKRLALGQYPKTGLAEARRKRDAARELLAAGEDPGAVRREAKRALLVAAEQSFKAVARRWWGEWRVNRTDRYAEYVLRRLETDAFPSIGAVPIGKLTAPEVVRAVKRVRERGAAELPRRIWETCSQVLRFAVVEGLIVESPLRGLKVTDLQLKATAVQNFARVGVAELPDLLRAIVAYDGSVYTRMALQLMALTFVRTSELIGAQWREFDLAAAEWTIPADRVGRKGAIGERRSHLVPLSRQSLEVLGYLRSARGSAVCHGAALLFPGERDHARPMSNNTLLKALERMGYGGRQTGHGFRGIASTGLNEMSCFRPDVIEAQLSHGEPDRVRAAYNHADYLADRRQLMQVWADYLQAVREGGKPIAFRSWPAHALNAGKTASGPSKKRR